MESVLRVKKSLRTPIRKLTRWVSRVKERRLSAKHRNRRSRRRRGGGRGGRGGCSKLGRTPLHRTSHPKEPSITCVYQADLEKERKLREATNAQKNAGRATMRDHFRRKYQLSESPKDTNHLRTAGRKVSLPRELSKIIHPKTKTKDDGFDLLSAFQGLSFGTTALTGRKHSKTSTPTPPTCKVM
ncbi:complexin-3-like [Sebastes umbrosus]|uniref:complexin-3-like n=1 Tax=Sebastes umbrosus TaxID=72105 RepID=UPI00189F7340|nr:complexin-3-like [Sebastes umbrosus]